MTEGKPFVFGWVIGHTPVINGYFPWRENSAQGKSFLFRKGYLSNALVLLATFDIGAVVELGWESIKIVGSIKQAKEICVRDLAK